MTRPPPAAAAAKASPLFRPPVVIATLTLLALAVRVPLLNQSLWYDELFTLIHYVAQPWAKVVAGNYSPNNHVLFTAFAKVCTTLVPDPDIAIRLPSLVAGSAAGLLLAWPIRRTHPRAALLLALLGALHPWGVAISGWARGYPLLLCLCTVATLLLMAGRRWAYAAAVVAAMYTHPIAIAVVLGHCLAIVLFERRQWKAWLAALVVAGVATVLLYLPLVMGARGYWTQPEKPSITYGQFVVQSLRHANAGANLESVGHVLTTLLVVGLGLPLAWRRWAALRMMIVTFGVASLFATLSPLLIPLSGEVRAMLWLIPLYCLGTFGLLTATGRLHPAWWAVPLLFFGLRDVAIQQTPGHAIREGVAEARRLADERGRAVIGVYMASREVRRFYVRPDGTSAIDLVAMAVDDRQELPGLREVERKAGGTPVAIVFYEDFMRRDEPELWAYLERHYRVVRVLPGRIGDVKVFVRNEAISR